MTPTYRLIHFTPNPFTGARYPLAAAISWGDGRPDTIVDGHLPGPACLGSMGLYRMARRMLDDLVSLTDASRLPVAYETVALLDRPMRLPEVPQPEQWIRENLLLGKIELNHLEKAPQKHIGPRRGTLGRRFFASYRMNHVVRNDFNPRLTFPDPERWVAVPNVTHYAGGAKRVVLVEPLDLRRRVFLEDATKIARSFAMYRQARVSETVVHTVAMILPHADEDADKRGQVVSAVENFVDEVIDVTFDDDRDKLFRDLHEAAKASAA